MLAATLVSTYFAFVLFACSVILQYGSKVTDLGWQIEVVGGSYYIAQVKSGGPAVGQLEAGDRVLEINGTALVNSASEVKLRAALRAMAGEYSVRIIRNGQVKQVALRSESKSGLDFFRERMPVLGASLVVFLAALALLLNWHNTTARYGFVAAIALSLRLGAWSILPLGSFFRPDEFRPYFVFWWPVELALPMAYQALLSLRKDAKPAPWLRMVGWALMTDWYGAMLFLAFTGSLPAPVPEGTAFLFWDHIEYGPIQPVMQIGMLIRLILLLGAAAAWVIRLEKEETDLNQKRRLRWLLASGLFFALPGGVHEVRLWLGEPLEGNYNIWLPAMMALTFSYVVSAERVMSMSAVARSLISAVLPESVFAGIDRRFFVRQSKIEHELREVASRVESCNDLARLQEVLTQGLEKALDAPAVKLHPELSVEDMLELGQRHSGEPYSRRERRLIQAALSKFLLTQDARGGAGSEHMGNRNFLRECPACGACYESDVVQCAKDGEVPVITFPISRLLEGKYLLERRIGRGGMGAVYLCKDIRLNRRVAVKILLSELFGHGEALKRFEREAQAVARLNHPNVVQVYDFGPIGQMGAFLVMEHVSGRSWRKELEFGSISFASCLPWVAQLLDGIQAAHQAGIVHRDLKPENLYLSNADGLTDQLKILDFGLAKIRLLDLSRDEKLSIDVRAIGTIGYIPPEQLTGAKGDERSDIYSIGRILLETFTGSLPEPGAELPPMPEPLGSILRKSVANNMEDRHFSIAELRSELLPVLREMAELEERLDDSVDHEEFHSPVPESTAL
ncbi:MAG: protein kinase [Candidatus Solibacter usitatus]|nr:protein kinase [Candidatus Solibacter usitatus]